jgi:hypothetical protein
VILLVFGIQLLYGLQLHAQQADVDAMMSAKAAATVDTVSLCPDRAPSPVGTFISFDPPDSQGTIAVAINPFDTVAGYYSDADGNLHGFVRSVTGQIVSFDADTAPAGFFQETVVLGINTLGEVTGFYFDLTGASYGFVRSNSGQITLFNAPDADLLLNGTTPTAIRDDGTITGNYQDVNGVFHGFVRAHDGVTTSFDDPEAGTGSNEGTFPIALNAKGTIVGCISDSTSDGTGFIDTGGIFGVVIPPGSIDNFLSPFCGTFLTSLPGISINLRGRSPEPTFNLRKMISASIFVVTCGLRTTPTTLLTLFPRLRRHAAPGRFRPRSARRDRSSDSRTISVARIMLSCVPPTAQLRCSMPLTLAAVFSRAPSLAV